MTASAVPEPKWFAVSTRRRHETVVHQQLQQKHIESFLPTVSRRSRWTDRRKIIEWPLFPGYCFIRCQASEMLPILRCAGVVRVVSFDGKPAVIDEQEIQNLRLLVASRWEADPCPLAKEGSLVEVTGGPLRGVIGHLERKVGSRATVVLAVELIGQAVRIEVDGADVRPCAFRMMA